MERLHDTTIRSLKAPERGQKIHHDASLPGFGLRVSQGGAKTFVLMVGRERQLITIGRYPVISLADARNEARRLLAERTLNRHRPTRLRFSEAVERFFTEKEAQYRPNTLRTSRGIFRREFSHLGSRYLADITTDDITRATDKLLKAGKHRQANHVLVYAKTFLTWCVRRRLIPHSPAEALERPAAVQARERVLSDDEIRRIWAATENDTPFNTIIRLCFLLGQRRGELSKVTPDWIHGDILTIPSTVTKNKRQHHVVCGSLALELLQRAPFPSLGWSKQKALLDIRSDVHDWVIHDARRSLATIWQRLGIRSETIDAYQNHISNQSAITRTYQRHRYEAEMREAVQTYEEWFRRDIMGANDTQRSN